MRALSIRQPYAELILRGLKTAEYRTRPTRIVGQPFYIYAAKTPGDPAGFAQLGCEPGDLPTGLLVGVATIAACVPGGPSGWAWHLTDVARLAAPRRPTRHPQPAWFLPFDEDDATLGVVPDLSAA